ncbi:MAG: site-specific DNA-methyltransferase [Candidatus Daviesbacteria bacterium]|nr:site-specific DNA-methyltransferase [Candidatus Daviesbacteria bacterium]
MNKYFIKDARHIRDLNIPPVDLIITSPPYFDMKDYGSDNQIGYGQDYDTYLEDLGKVFKQCFDITKDTGSLWMIVDILRKEGKTFLVPFDVIKKVEASGWTLQDIVIWKKDKTIPFSHKGQMRNIFEYILSFSKTNDFKFYRNRITSIDTLKEWWPKYPERYSPNGKSETNIWDFPIPLQGSWGNTYIKHFCPLPEKLIERIIDLCSDINNIVFDPFAGSGAVLSAAYRLNRKYVGSDLNPKYKKMFLAYIKKIKPVNKSSQYNQNNLRKFSNTIEKLRLLKFPKKIYLELVNKYPKLSHNIIAIIALPNKLKKTKIKNHFIAGNYIFVTRGKSELSVKDIQGIVNVRPLSKYGIQSTLSILETTQLTKTLRKIKEPSFWRYDNGVTYHPGENVKKLDRKVLEKIDKFRIPPIFTTIEIAKEDLII